MESFLWTLQLNPIHSTALPKIIERLHNTSVYLIQIYTSEQLKAVRILPREYYLPTVLSAEQEMILDEDDDHLTSRTAFLCPVKTL